MNFPNFNGSNFNVRNRVNRRPAQATADGRRHVDGDPRLFEIVHTFERIQERLLDRVDSMIQENTKKVEDLPKTIKDEVLNCEEFKKIRKDCKDAKKDTDRLDKRLEHAMAEHKDLKRRLEKLERSEHRRSSHSRSRAKERRPRGVPSSTSKSSHRHSHEKDGRPSGASENRGRSDDTRERMSMDKERSDKRRKERSDRSEQRKDQTDDRATERQRRSDTPEYAKEPGPSGVQTARFTRAGGITEPRRPNMGDRFITREWQTRKPRGPGDPPLSKGKTQKKKKGPINSVREKKTTKRQIFTYGQKECALNFIEKMVREGANLDDAFLILANDKDK